MHLQQTERRRRQRTDSLGAHVPQFFCKTKAYLLGMEKNQPRHTTTMKKGQIMVKEIIEHAQEAIRRGDVVAAIGAKKALGHVVRKNGCGNHDPEHLAQKHKEICDGIAELIHQKK